MQTEKIYGVDLGIKMTKIENKINEDVRK